MLIDFLNVIKAKFFNNHILFSFFYLLRKRRLKFNHNIDVKSKVKFKIEKELGFLKLRLKDKEIFEAIKHCKKTIKPQPFNKEKTKDYLYTQKIDVFKNKPILELATNENIISIIANYFKTIPILYYAGVWHSKEKQSHEYKGSQLFHFDREDLHQIKLFIPIERISDDSGPLNVLNVKSTTYFIKKNLAKFKFINKKDRFKISFYN